ncbi:MAG: SRPBCC family protein [Chloroflexi bacterium]|nr:SRPBCC family protein [Chloroflexota bacterium]
MASIGREIAIKAPVEKVFGYLADFSRHGEWSLHSLEVSQGPAAEGDAFESRGRMWGLNIRNDNVVTELVPNRRIVFESVSPGGRFRNAFLVEGQGDTTLLVKQVEVLQPRAVLWPLVRFGFPLVAGRRMQQDLERIKAKLEAGQAGD